MRAGLVVKCVLTLRMAPQTHCEKSVLGKAGQIASVLCPFVPEGGAQQASRDFDSAFTGQSLDGFHQSRDFLVIVRWQAGQCVKWQFRWP